MKFKWRMRGLIRDRFTEWSTLGEDLRAVFTGPVGSRAFSPAARDLLRVGLAVHSIERALPGSPGGNRPVEFEVTLRLEEPDRWSPEALEALQELLSFQGDAAWRWTMRPGALTKAGFVAEGKPETRSVKRIALFSGGLDSTSGIASDRELTSDIQLVSHYSRQKSAQLGIASALKYGPPTQVRIDGMSGRGRGFLHRSFYFLCLAATVASTYKTHRIVQYENGILATAMPPAPAYFMTRHAHPVVHRLAEKLFRAVLGGEWVIHNPFLKLTKRQCYLTMEEKLGVKQATAVAAMTESCWYTNSNQYLGGHKKANGVPCGVCIPCIVRRTATQVHSGEYDLNRRAVRADPVLSRDLQAYGHFADRALDQEKLLRLFLEMPSYVRGLVRGGNAEFTRAELMDLMRHFAEEFRDVFPA